MAQDKARIYITAEDKTREAFTSVQRNLGQLQSSARSVSGAFAAFGVGLSVGAFAAFVKSSIDAADRLNDLSKSTSISVELLAGLGLAAKQSGTDLEGVAQSINKLSVNIGKDSEKFAKLGVTAKEPLEAFKQLADVFVAIKDPQERAAVAAEALGKSWASAAPLLAEGGEAIGKMVTNGTKVAGITKDMADQADKFNDQLEELKARASQAGISIASDLLPVLNSAIKEFQLGIKHAGGFGSALLALGAINPFRNAQENIREYSEELAELEKNRPSGTGNYFGSVQEQEIARIDAAIKKKKIQIGFLREAAQEEALLLGKGFENYKIPAVSVSPTDKPNTAGFLAGEDKKQKAKEAIDVFDNGSFVTKNKEAADFIKEQYKTINELQRDIAEQAETIDVFGGSFKAGKENAEFIAAQFREVNDLQSQMSSETEELKRKYKELADPLTPYRKQLEEIAGLKERFPELAETWGVAEKKVLEDMAKAAQDANKAAKEVASTFTSAFQDAVVGGKDLNSVMRDLAQNLARLAIKETLTEPMNKFFADVLNFQSQSGSTSGGGSGWIGSLLSLFGSSGGGGGSDFSSSSEGFFDIFANGGIMTSGGQLPLKKYANGGIANSPQFSIFGEGSTPEAYVPLPDGRSIPVKMQGGGNGGITVVNNYQIDARGAAAGVDEDVRRAINESENRAVTRSVAQVKDLNQRGQLRFS